MQQQLVLWGQVFTALVTNQFLRLWDSTDLQMKKTGNNSAPFQKCLIFQNEFTGTAKVKKSQKFQGDDWTTAELSHLNKCQLSGLHYSIDTG